MNTTTLRGLLKCSSVSRFVQVEYPCQCFASAINKMASHQLHVSEELVRSQADTQGRSKIYMQGELLKRQRGVHHPNKRNLKFQKRYFVLNQAALEYYEKEADLRKPNKVQISTGSTDNIIKY